MKRIICVVIWLIVGSGLVSAQYYFGRNKIQYNSFDWHILQTEHFDIYYYPEMEELAEIGAAYAEESYTFLENKFNHNILRRIPLIFYSNHSHFQQTNTLPYLIPPGVGGFFEYLKGRVVLPCDGSISEFKHVIRHELVHVFTHSKLNRMYKDRKDMNGKELPLWFTEGLAEYWSEGWDSQAEMFIRDAVLNNYLFPVKDMFQIYGTFLMYKEGQAIVKFISEKYGDEKILQLIDNYWREKNFSDVMKLTLGVDYEEFDREWVYHLKKQKYPLLSDADMPTHSSVEITELGINAKPVYFQDGEQDRVIFISNRVGYTNIYWEPIQNTGKEADASVLIKGERNEKFESLNLLKSKIDIRPDGCLAFVSKSGQQDVIYVFDIYARKIIHEIKLKDIITIYSPNWAPDGQKIVFNGLAFSGKSDLYVYEFSTSRLTRLTNDYYDDRDPAWSPDGQVIAFSSDRGVHGRNGFYNLFLFELETDAIRYITSSPANDLAPAWSPTGHQIAFSSDRDGAFNIWIIENISQSEPRPQSFTQATSPVVLASSDPNLTHTSTYYKTSGSWFPESNLPYPVALEPTDKLSKLTSFTTGAFDPEWTATGNILFTAFENFSFQIKKLDNVQPKIASLQSVKPDSMGIKYSPWRFAKTSGETTTSKLKYRKKFSLDIAQSSISQDPIFGTSGGAQLGMSDMLGNTRYHFLIYNTARTKNEFLESFNVAITRVNLGHRANTAYGLYHFAGRFYNRRDFWFWERRYGGYGAISYPLSTFERLESSMNIRNSDKEWFGSGYRRQALMISNFVSFIRDNSLWGATGPVDGQRISVTLGNTIDIQHSNVNFYTVIGDLRNYFRLSQSVTYAVRLMGMFNEGKESTPFFMGGSWDLRGYRFWNIWGTKLALISNELRFPFIDRFAVNFPFGGVGFSAIRGAAFLDLGNGWDDQMDELLGSMGFGIRWRVGGFLVLRLDMGRKLTISDPDQISQFLKPDISRNWFTQFFFGWDF